MRIIFIIVFLISCIQLYTQSDYRIEVIDNTKGLSSDNVNFIFQDSDGCMWFGSYDGLNKYNGYEILPVKSPNSSEDFNNAYISCIAEDPEGNLWIGTRMSGVFIYNKYLGTIDSFKIWDDNQFKDNVTCLLLDSFNNMWIATWGNKLYKFNTLTKDLSVYSYSTLSSENPHYFQIRNIREGLDGEIWIANRDTSIGKYSPNTDKISTHYLDNPFFTISLFFDSKKTLWLGTWAQGLLRVDSIDDSKVYYEQVKIAMNEKNTISDEIIYSIDEDKDNNIWIGHQKGFDVIKRVGNSYKVENYSSKNLNIMFGEVIKIFFDRSGIAWLSIIDKGITKLEKKHSTFETIKIPEILEDINSQIIYSIYPINETEYLLGIKSLGFLWYNLSNNKFKSYNNLFDFSSSDLWINSVYCFSKDINNRLWLGTRYNGLFYIDKNKTTINPFPISINSNTIVTVYSITSDLNGNIWLGTENGIIQINYHNNSDSLNIKNYFRFNKFNDFPLGSSINTVYCDSKNNILIGSSYNGLIKLCKNNRLEYFRHETNNLNCISSNNISSIFEDSRERLWIGTSKGIDLADIENKKFKNFNEKAGLLGDIVYSITEVNNNELWLGTNKGLSRFLPDKPEGKQFENFTVEEGLPSNIFLQNAVSKTDDGKLIFGSTNGIVKFDPKKISTNKYIPKVTITDIWIANERLPVDFRNNKEVVLSHNENIAIIGFDTYSYSQPLKNKFAYRLKGFNDTWIFTSAENRKAYYSNLTPGKYIFQVKGSNSSGLWNHAPAEIEITVLPPPYLTWWAIMLYCFGGVGLTILTFAILLSRSRLKQELKLHNIKQRFFINVSHELLTPLSVILALSENLSEKFRKKNKDHIELLVKNTNRLKHLLKQLLDFRKTETDTLQLNICKSDINVFINQVTTNFELLADKLKIEFEKKILPKSQNAFFDSDKLDKIMHNLLSNAFKYTPEGGKVVLKLEKTILKNNPYARLTVSDTGKGIEKGELKHIFERFYRVGNHAVEGLGIGLALTKRLVELHNGTISIESKVGIGTSFTVDIPIFKEAYQESQIIENGDDNNVSPSSYIDVQQNSTDYDNPEQDLQKHSILIVEDNSDLRRVMMEYLQKYYNVMGAENGKNAFDIILEKQPTLIISDIMMPVWDGIELCKKIKTTFETSHIPVVLLTAKSTDDSRIEGYKYGADSYLNKPVNFNILITRIQAIINQRERLRLSLQANKNLSPEEIILPSLDEKFINDTKNLVSKFCHDNEFNSERFASEMNMSVSLLYMKMKNVMGLTPMNYLKKYRLQVAADILSQGRSVSEAAQKTGFNEISYFSVCFKEEYGISPSNYKKENNN